MTDLYEYYWLIGTRIDDISEYHPHEQKAGPKRAFCRMCKDVLDDWYPKTLAVELQNVDRAVSIRCGPSRKNRACIRIIHADVWNQIAHLCPTAVRGEVSLWEREFLVPSTEWVCVLFPPAEQVHIRGSYTPERSITGGVAHHVCPGCHRQRYYACNDQHLVRCQVPKNKSVFMSRIGDLVIAEPIAQAMDWASFSDFEYQRLPVLEKPLDGMRLIGDPDWSAM